MASLRAKDLWDGLPLEQKKEMTAIAVGWPATSRRTTTSQWRTRSTMSWRHPPCPVIPAGALHQDHRRGSCPLHGHGAEGAVPGGAGWRLLQPPAPPGAPAGGGADHHRQGDHNRHGRGGAGGAARVVPPRPRHPPRQLAVPPKSG
uniref:Uncharacterized protein n=1 Tax=Aegilops tauschii subsp. strangulata TaxID=200361 RepID=A0A452ZTQ7_AEGTS